MFKYRKLKPNLTDKLQALGFECIVPQYLYRRKDLTEIKIFKDKTWRILNNENLCCISTKLSEIYEYLIEKEETNGTI